MMTSGQCTMGAAINDRLCFPSVTADPGQSVQLSATVTTQNFAPQEVTWQSSVDNVTVSPAVVVSLNESATGSATITATSVYDNKKKGTSTITIA